MSLQNTILEVKSESYKTYKTTQLTFMQKQNSNIRNETAEIANFYFSHYTSLQIESCHSSHSSYPYTMKHIVSRMISYFPNRWPLSYLNLTKNMKTYIRRQQHKKNLNTKT